jgi:hypothetical protein
MKLFVLGQKSASGSAVSKWHDPALASQKLSVLLAEDRCCKGLRIRTDIRDSNSWLTFSSV